MQYLIYLLLLVHNFLWSQSSPESSSDADEVTASVIVDGLFFDVSATSKSLFSEGAESSILRCPDGMMVMAVYLPEGCDIEESLAEKSTPASKVKYATALLHEYYEQRTN